jgi:site-specific DNA recombinase
MKVDGWSIEQRGAFEPLVDEAIFGRVQRLLSGKRLGREYLRTHPDFPLRHFVRCDSCGGPITGSWSKGRSRRYAYYHCPKQTCRAVTERKEAMEAAFVELLEQLKPQPAYLRLFKEVVLDVWKQRQAQAAHAARALRRRLDELQALKDRLVGAFVYRQQIDQQTYERETNLLNDKIDAVRGEMADATADEIDVEGVVRYAEFVALNAARLWQQASTEQKQPLQAALFPEGLRFGSGGFRTPVTSLFFRKMEAGPIDGSRVATLAGFEPAISTLKGWRAGPLHHRVGDRPDPVV